MPDFAEHVADLVDDYLHALLSPQRAAEVERHCDGCPACRAALDAARRRRALLQSLPPREAPPRLVAATLRRIGEHDRTRFRRRVRFFALAGAALAACALVALGVQTHYQRLSATPYDLVVLGQRNLLAATRAALCVRLVDRSAGRDLAGVPVVVELRGGGRSAELARFTTDARGAAQPPIDLPDWPDGNYELIVTAQAPGAAETVTRPVRLTRSWKLMLTSDKPVYQPGQTVHVRALALRQPDLRPVAEREAVFTLADPKGNILFKHAGRTSRYGIAAVDCPLATEIPEGAWTLACTVGDTESRLRVEVRKYVLPKFKLDVRPDRTFYQPGETAHVVVQADYFFGKPVADAAVEVEVRKGAEVVHRFNVRTDAKGAAAVDCAAPDVPADADSRLSFVATVTDSAGQKQARAVERTVTRRPVRVEVLPENGTLVAGVRNVVYLLATRADGTPLRARLTVEGPNEVVDTDETGLASCEVTPQGGSLEWLVVVHDAAGKLLARRPVSLPCGPAAGDFLLRTDRGAYESGQTMRLTADSPQDQLLFVDVVKDGQTMLSQTLAVSGGHGSCAIDLPPELSGTLRLCAYRLGAGGVALSKTRVVPVRPSRQLTIAPKLDRPEYRPGRRARLELALTGADGRPCPGAISLAGVDEAVFAVLPQRPGTEEAFYTLEQPLLQPVYALYPWSPSRRAGDGRLEQALFAATARTQTDGRAQSAIDLADPSGVHSLAATSWPAKVRQVEGRRSDAAERLHTVWALLLLAGLGLGYAALWGFLSARTVLLLHATAAPFTCMPLLFLALLSFGGCGAKEGAATGGKSTAPPVGSAAPRRDFDLGNTDLGNDDTVPLNYNVDRLDDVSVPGQVNPAKPAAPRVRKAFPETLLWAPQVITDDDGRAHLDIDLADSITTWRLSASAVAADGRLGAAELPLRVFQPFFVDLNLPVSLTRNDEISVPVVVYNYLDKPQTVALKLEPAAWFALAGDAEQRLELAPREVRSTTYRIKAKQAGSHSLQVSASAGGVADALKRTVEVVPDGRRVEQVFNGSLRQPGGATLLVPDDAIDGSVWAFVKIYPSGFSQLVEGLENIFRMPHGCFEQTSSTTYPNVLALDYLRRTKQSAPQVEAKARQYIHLGYQRLVGFEVPGGGFDWYGRPPANLTLTAYGLMEFDDMARVHDVDPRLIERTRRWLLGKRRGDGSWEADLRATAYIAWAVFGGAGEGDPAPTRAYLLGHSPDDVRDPYTLALVCNALLAIDPQGGAAAPYLDRLEALRHTGDGGKLAWWQQPDGAQTIFYGAGRGGDIETTALASLALVRGGRPGPAGAALAWLVTQKDARGTWHSTQATVLALKALLAGADAVGSGERRVLVRLGDKFRQEIVIPADRAEVMRQLDLSPLLTPGRQRLELTETTATGAAYQVTFRYHVPRAKAEDAGPLAVRLDYDRTELPVGGTVKATAKVANRRKEASAMVMVDLPVPAGFAVWAEDFAALAQQGRVARYEVRGDRVLVYLRELKPSAPLELPYRLRATTAGRVAAPPARVWEYYDPDCEGHGTAARFTVTAGH